MNTKEVIKSLLEIDTKLTELKKDFNVQMNTIEFDTNEFHKHLSEVLTKHPELKSIVDFVVFSNDVLERNQKEVRSVVVDSLNEIMALKISSLKELIKKYENDLEILERSNNKKPSTSLLDKINTFKELKWVITAILMLVIILGFIFVPDSIIKALSWIAKIL